MSQEDNIYNTNFKKSEGQYDSYAHSSKIPLDSSYNAQQCSQPFTNHQSYPYNAYQQLNTTNDSLVRPMQYNSNPALSHGNNNIYNPIPNHVSQGAIQRLPNPALEQIYGSPSIALPYGDQKAFNPSISGKNMNGINSVSRSNSSLPLGYPNTLQQPPPSIMPQINHQQFQNQHQQLHQYQQQQHQQQSFYQQQIMQQPPPQKFQQHFLNKQQQIQPQFHEEALNQSNSRFIYTGESSQSIHPLPYTNSQTIYHQMSQQQQPMFYCHPTNSSANSTIAQPQLQSVNSRHSQKGMIKKHSSQLTSYNRTSAISSTKTVGINKSSNNSTQSLTLSDRKSSSLIPKKPIEEEGDEEILSEEEIQSILATFSPPKIEKWLICGVNIHIIVRPNGRYFALREIDSHFVRRAHQTEKVKEKEKNKKGSKGNKDLPNAVYDLPQQLQHNSLSIQGLQRIPDIVPLYSNYQEPTGRHDLETRGVLTNRYGKPHHIYKFTPGCSDPTARAYVRQACNEIGIQSVDATKQELEMLRSYHVIGRNGPKATLIPVEQTALLQRAFDLISQEKSITEAIDRIQMESPLPRYPSIILHRYLDIFNGNVKAEPQESTPSTSSFHIRVRPARYNSMTNLTQLRDVAFNEICKGIDRLDKDVFDYIVNHEENNAYSGSTLVPLSPAMKLQLLQYMKDDFTNLWEVLSFTSKSQFTQKKLEILVKLHEYLGSSKDTQKVQSMPNRYQDIEEEEKGYNPAYNENKEDFISKNSSDIFDTSMNLFIKEIMTMYDPLPVTANSSLSSQLLSINGIQMAIQSSLPQLTKSISSNSTKLQDDHYTLDTRLFPNQPLDSSLTQSFFHTPQCSRKGQYNKLLQLIGQEEGYHKNIKNELNTHKRTNTMHFPCHYYIYPDFKIETSSSTSNTTDFCSSANIAVESNIPFNGGHSQALQVSYQYGSNENANSQDMSQYRQLQGVGEDGRCVGYRIHPCVTMMNNDINSTNHFGSNSTPMKPGISSSQKSRTPPIPQRTLSSMKHEAIKYSSTVHDLKEITASVQQRAIISSSLTIDPKESEEKKKNKKNKKDMKLNVYPTQFSHLQSSSHNSISDVSMDYRHPIPDSMVISDSLHTSISMLPKQTLALNRSASSDIPASRIKDGPKLPYQGSDSIDSYYKTTASASTSIPIYESTNGKMSKPMYGSFSAPGSVITSETHSILSGGCTSQQCYSEENSRMSSTLNSPILEPSEPRGSASLYSPLSLPYDCIPKEKATRTINEVESCSSLSSIAIFPLASVFQKYFSSSIDKAHCNDFIHRGDCLDEDPLHVGFDSYYKCATGGQNSSKTSAFDTTKSLLYQSVHVIPTSTHCIQPQIQESLLDWEEMNDQCLVQFSQIWLTAIKLFIKERQQIASNRQLPDDLSNITYPKQYANAMYILEEQRWLYSIQSLKCISDVFNYSVIYSQLQQAFDIIYKRFNTLEHSIKSILTNYLNTGSKIWFDDTLSQENMMSSDKKDNSQQFKDILQQLYSRSNQLIEDVPMDIVMEAILMNTKVPSNDVSDYGCTNYLNFLSQAHLGHKPTSSTTNATALFSDGSLDIYDFYEKFVFHLQKNIEKDAEFYQEKTVRFKIMQFLSFINDRTKEIQKRIQQLQKTSQVSWGILRVALDYCEQLTKDIIQKAKQSSHHSSHTSFASSLKVSSSNHLLSYFPASAETMNSENMHNFPLDLDIFLQHFQRFSKKEVWKDSQSSLSATLTSDPVGNIIGATKKVEDALQDFLPKLQNLSTFVSSTLACNCGKQRKYREQHRSDCNLFPIITKAFALKYLSVYQKNPDSDMKIQGVTISKTKLASLKALYEDSSSSSSYPNLLNQSSSMYNFLPSNQSNSNFAKNQEKDTHQHSPYLSTVSSATFHDVLDACYTMLYAVLKEFSKASAPPNILYFSNVNQCTNCCPCESTIQKTVSIMQSGIADGLSNNMFSRGGSRNETNSFISQVSNLSLNSNNIIIGSKNDPSYTFSSKQSLKIIQTYLYQMLSTVFDSNFKANQVDGFFVQPENSKHSFSSPSANSLPYTSHDPLYINNFSMVSTGGTSIKASSSLSDDLPPLLYVFKHFGINTMNMSLSEYLSNSCLNSMISIDSSSSHLNKTALQNKALKNPSFSSKQPNIQTHSTILYRIASCLLSSAMGCLLHSGKFRNNYVELQEIVKTRYSQFLNMYKEYFHLTPLRITNLEFHADRGIAPNMMSQQDNVDPTLGYTNIFQTIPANGTYAMHQGLSDIVQNPMGNTMPNRSSHLSSTYFNPSSFVPPFNSDNTIMDVRYPVSHPNSFPYPLSIDLKQMQDQVLDNKAPDLAIQHNQLRRGNCNYQQQSKNDYYSVHHTSNSNSSQLGSNLQSRYENNPSSLEPFLINQEDSLTSNPMHDLKIPSQDITHYPPQYHAKDLLLDNNTMESQLPQKFFDITNCNISNESHLKDSQTEDHDDEHLDELKPLNLNGSFNHSPFSTSNHRNTTFLPMDSPQTHAIHQQPFLFYDGSPIEKDSSFMKPPLFTSDSNSLMLTSFDKPSILSPLSSEAYNFSSLSKQDSGPRQEKHLETSQYPSSFKPQETPKESLAAKSHPFVDIATLSPQISKNPMNSNSDHKLLDSLVKTTNNSSLQSGDQGNLNPLDNLLLRMSPCSTTDRITEDSFSTKTQIESTNRHPLFLYNAFDMKTPREKPPQPTKSLNNSSPCATENATSSDISQTFFSTVLLRPPLSPGSILFPAPSSISSISSPIQDLVSTRSFTGNTFKDILETKIKTRSTQPDSTHEGKRFKH